MPYWGWFRPQATGRLPAAFSRPGLDSGRDASPSTPLPANTPDIVLHDSNQAEFAGYVKGSPTRWRWAVGTGTPIGSTPRSTYSLRPAVQGLPHAAG
ncbi:hypothetical protein Snoj_20040 [Streptomyces nojiriensis]|uniref:Uncharacterized protein n=1 Tax=Streptomyces nojiriensis TaxID=66374 RepID=A0ABQ3SIX6_9ACTN|nr:hypothetical protein GCM10010205_62010 [Streptomyces nojiriensis]GHI68086.1 hypothetical protein Snoj_20040 [Streptomyces nojiriensis]